MSLPKQPLTMVVPNQKVALIIYQGFVKVFEGTEKMYLTADSGVRSENNFS